MRDPTCKHANRAPILLLACIVTFGNLSVGCSRSKYRLAADQEAYNAIAQRNGDPRWSTVKYDIEPDPRSRYADVYDPDCPPIPIDDPASQQYMRCVDGKKGWQHWYDGGIRAGLENPAWQALLGEYVELADDGAVMLDIDSALRLAYVHSPNHQSQLETLYLSSLDVTRERFELDTQFFGGYDIGYSHNGLITPARLAHDGSRWVIAPPIAETQSNVLAIGTTGQRRALETRRQFATAGTLLTGFANSFVFEFTGPDAGLSASLLNFTFLQPLLRGAGRDIGLEGLTQVERTLLANLRSYAQFRQGFYTQVAIGELGVVGPQRTGRGTSLQVFGGQAQLGGYVGLLRQLQQIRNAEDNLNLQIRTLAQLEALLVAGLIDLVQVDQFRQNVERDRASLLQSRNDFLRSLDQYKAFTLGLPPDLSVDLNDDLIHQFQLVDRAATAIQDTIAELQTRPSELGQDPDPAAIESLRGDVYELVQPLRQNLGNVADDITLTKDSIPLRRRAMDEAAKEAFDREIAELDTGYADLLVQLERIEVEVERMKAGLPRLPDPDELSLRLDEDEDDAAPVADGPDSDSPDSDSTIAELVNPSADATSEIDRTVILLRKMLRLIQGSILVQARARLEAVSVDTIALETEQAFQIALQNRLDFMNGRAALVDDWRQIQIAADALQSVLDFSASGSVQTDRNNPLSFRGSTGSAAVGLRFDAPLTRLLERNQYRESLINYQRSRRALIQSHDSLHLGLRVLLREIEQLRTNLEIQRRAVAIAIRRVDVTGSALYAPVPPPQPGQRSAPFGPTAAINLLSAQSALRDTQNSFLTAWLSYYAAKLRLARELGVMELDLEGRRVASPLPGEVPRLELDTTEFEPLPPPISQALIDAAQLSAEGLIEAVE
ncbi:Outer membrane efflux protein [Stieleria neptunia]|uniref:Outer membrane efflux protein n=1 Tax=Stieleria neptunia TaxID=2527979 RepID=A0A518I4B0_9BACT|nr:TolC family protein [Stieleria neptunia]QDV47906.1 Outer membrane efflux protein [Stieleria neptunia]